ncbi:MAG: thioester reductase domain-containing protein [Myxococcales bacterium]|nr:thioester reductase domain-containing protein [Myxococcales bacterium]
MSDLDAALDCHYWTPQAPIGASRRPSRFPSIEGAPPLYCADMAHGKWTKQSSVDRDPPTMYSRPTRREPAPFWTIDLGASTALEHVTLWIEAVDPDVRVRVEGYAFESTSRGPPEGSYTLEALAGDLPVAEDGTLVLLRAVDWVARFVRVTLVAPDGSLPRLWVRGIILDGTELYGDTLALSYQRAFTRFAQRPLFSARAQPGEGPFSVTHRYIDLWNEARLLAASLARALESRRYNASADAPARVMFGVCTRNRPEWLAAEIAAVLRGYVVVNLSPDDDEERLANVLSRCALDVVLCDGAAMERVCAAARKTGTVDLVVALDDTRFQPSAAPTELPTTQTDALSVRSYRSMLDERGPAPPPPIARSQGDTHTILFTSGSTGTPKGAMRSYARFNAVIQSYGAAQPALHLSFQPLSHLSERNYLPAAVLHGSHIGLSSGGEHVLSDLAAFEPTWVASVPRLFDAVFRRHTQRVEAQKRAHPERSHDEIERDELRVTRGAFGRNLQGVSTGSAPVSPEVLSFLRRCFSDLWVFDGYGSTEVGTITSNFTPVSNVDLKVVPVDGVDPGGGAIVRGELWVRSLHAIDGYYNDPETTAASFDHEGFFRTGDIVERDLEKNAITVLGRKSNTVKLANGEFVTLERCEGVLNTCAMVDRVVLTLDPEGGSLFAIVIARLEPLAAALSVTHASALDALVSHPRAESVVLAALVEHGASAGLRAYELPRRVIVDAKPFSTEDRTLTASQKIDRKGVLARYREALAALSATPVERVARGQTLADRLAAIATAVTRRPVSADDRLHEGLGLDSLASAEVLAAFATELGRDVPLAHWSSSSTLRALAERIEASIDPTLVARVTLADDCALALGPFDRALPSFAHRAPERVLLTGATGLLGAHVLESLLRRTRATVRCLVRATSDDEATARVRSALERYRLAPLESTRWSAVRADLAAPSLGLDAATLDGLAGECDAVVHCAATVNWLTAYEPLRAPNVLATRSLVELCRTHTIKPLHFVSTISTAPSDGDEGSFLPLDSAARAGGYAASKWVAEHLARRARAEGAPVCVHRPGLITGHSARGLGNPTDFVHRYLAACRRYRVALDHPATLDMTPVDFVADAIVAALVEPSSAGRVLHLCNVERSMTFTALGRSLAALGPCELVDYESFRGRAALDRDSPLRPLAAFFGASFSLGSGPWPSRATRAWLAERGVVCPAIDDAMIARYVRGLEPVFKM